MEKGKPLKKQTTASIQKQIRKMEKQRDARMVVEMKRESTEKEKSRVKQKSELTEKVLSKYFDPQSIADLGYREILLQGILNRNKSLVKYAIEKGLTRIINAVQTFEVVDADSKITKKLIKELYFDALMRIETEDFEDTNEKINLYELRDYLYEKL